MDGASGRQYVESDLDARKARRTRRGESCQSGGPEKWKGDLTDLNAFASQHRYAARSCIRDLGMKETKLIFWAACVGSEYKFDCRTKYLLFELSFCFSTLGCWLVDHSSIAETS